MVRWTITLDPDNTRDTSEEALLNDLFEDNVERLNKMIRSSKGQQIARFGHNFTNGSGLARDKRFVQKRQA